MTRWGKTTTLLVLVASLTTVIGVRISQARVFRMELHGIPSITLSDQAFLSGRQDGEPVIVTGELRIPTPGDTLLPAVILLHGSGGVSGYLDDWARQLNALGIATLIIDGFTGRGLASVLDNQGQLGRLAMTFDAYRALELLARHPRIAPERIALMGFSRGGQNALYASLERFRQLHGPDDLAFAAYIAFYPLCNTRYRQDEMVADRPIRIFHGSADDFNPIAACRSYVQSLQAAGHDVRLIEYPGAHHAFDWPLLQNPLTLDEAITTRACRLAEGSDGHVINLDTGQPFGYDDPCVEYGPTVAHDAAAHNAARRAVNELLIEVFGLDS
jgi:dienelactone hydrolase